MGVTKTWYGITSSSDGTKLAATVDGGNIWTSTDSGATWTSRASSKSWYGITSSSDGTKLAAVVWGGNIWTSTDSGANWISRASRTDWRAITSSSDGTKLAATQWNGNIWTSTDYGVTWTSRASSQKWYGRLASSSDGTKLAATVSGGNIWTSTDYGVTWTEDTSVGDTKDWRGITSSSDGTKLAAVVHRGNIWTSTDSGSGSASPASSGSPPPAEEDGKTYPCDADGWCNRDWVALVLLGVALIFCVAGKRLHRLNVFILAAAIGSFAGLWIADTFNVDDFNTRWGICIGLAVAISLMVYMIESLVFSLLGVATCAGGAMVVYSALAEHLPSSTPAYTFHLVIGVAAAVGFLLGGVLKKAALTVIYRRVDRFPRDPARASPVVS